MVSQPTFDSTAFLRLAERMEYESWLLEAIYVIVEEELFPSCPDAVVYPIDKSKAQFFAHARGNAFIGDWRPGFLNAGAPLVFVSTFKLLDMLTEWVLEENGVPPTFRFQEKLRRLEASPVFPPLIESRSWLKERLVGFYRTLEPLRGTIVHDKHFTAQDGAIRVSSSKSGVVGPVVEISSGHLRALALTIVSVLRYIDDTWYLDDVREKILRHDLDQLAALHDMALLGQLRPFHTRVRVYTTDPNPLHVDPTAIQSDLATRYVNQDCSFDLRVLVAREGAVVAAYLFPWCLFSNPGSHWGHGIDAEKYRTEIPDDIKSDHLRRDAG